MRLSRPCTTASAARGTDFFRIADQLADEERDRWNRARHFVDDEVLPVINQADLGANSAFLLADL